MSRISASWLESIENLGYNQNKENDKNNSKHIIYHAGDLHWLEHTLKIGDAQAALDVLKKYMQYVTNDQSSFLMQQYMFAEFLTEVGKLSKQSGSCRISD